MPFLENVTRGRGIPPERLAAVAEHYLHFGGVSPINGINRDLIVADRGGAGPARLRTFPSTSATATGSPTSRTRSRRCGTTGSGVLRCSPRRPGAATPGCTQYQEDIARGRAAAGPEAPELAKLRQYFDHPLLIAMFADADPRRRRDAARGTARRGPAGVHRALHPAAGRRRGAGPTSTSARSATPARLVAAAAGYPDYDQVWQSRSGPPQVPWLEPDVGDHLEVAGRGGHQGGDRLPGRVRRRSHRSGVGPRQRAGRTGRRGRHRVRAGVDAQQRSPDSRNWRST